MEPIGRRLKKLLSYFVGGRSASGIEDSGINQIRKDCIYIIIELMPVPNFAANGIKLKLMIKKKKIPSHEAFLFALLQLPVGVERE